MRTILVIVGIALTLIGVLLPPIQALIPKLSLHFYHKQLKVRRTLYLIGALFALTAALSGFDALSGVGLTIIAALISLGESILVPAKVIPPLDKPVASLVKPGDFPDEALILGVEIEGRARAYPMSLLTPHHIVNDVLGDRPIAATYCPACRSGCIYYPVVQGMRLTFEPVTVRRRNMVMKDRETGSVWQHETGICLIGRLKGQQLELLTSEMCNWRTWLAEHPNTTLCTRPDGYRHPSPLGPVFERFVDHGPEHLVGPGVTGIDKRLGQHDFIIGIVVGGIPKAYPLKALMRKGMITDSIGGIPVRLAYEERANRVKAFKQADGGNEMHSESIPVVREWWLAWSEYHPQSELFEQEIENNNMGKS